MRPNPLPDYQGQRDTDYGDPDDTIMCDCNHRCDELEVREFNDKTICVNCNPIIEDRLNAALNWVVAKLERWFK